MKSSRQRGNVLIGLIIGVVLGLGIALGVAVYVTKVPIPFLATKPQRGGAEQDEAEARRNRDWNPNSPLQTSRPQAPRTPDAPSAGGTVGAAPAPSAPVPVVVAPPATPGTTTPAAKPTRPPVPVEANNSSSSDPIGDLARSRTGGGTQTAAASPSSSSGQSGQDPFVYFVQAGAFRGSEEAEAQRAKLSLMGVEARVTEREQAGRTVYRVRAGPFNKKDDADRLKERLDGGGLEAALVRVQR